MGDKKIDLMKINNNTDLNLTENLNLSHDICFQL